jgi:hypothetical protein
MVKKKRAKKSKKGANKTAGPENESDNGPDLWAEHSYQRSTIQCTKLSVLGHVTRSRLQKKAANFFLADEPLSFDRYYYLGMSELKLGPLYSTTAFREMVDFVCGYVDASKDERGVLTREHGRGGRNLDAISNTELRFSWLISGYLVNCAKMKAGEQQNKRVAELHEWFKKVLHLYGISLVIPRDAPKMEERKKRIKVLGLHDHKPFNFQVVE